MRGAPPITDDVTADEELTRLLLSICHETANWTGAIRLSAHLVDHEQSPVELASSAADIADLSARIGSLLALVRPLVTREAAKATGVFPAAVLAGLADVLEDHGGRGVKLSVARCMDLPEIAGSPETLHQLIITLAYYAIVRAAPSGTVSVAAEHRPADGTVAFVVEDSGPDEPEIAKRDGAILRGRALACALAARILAGLGGAIDVSCDGDRTRVTLAVPVL